jgi:hypothetical protein
MSRPAIPSRAQAEFLARVWSSGKPYCAGGFDPPTQRACIERGWLEPTNEQGEMPSGARWRGHVVSAAGLHALGHFLIKKGASR